jgi:2-polyprenyl-3-methyl-5-hydroxy-6-metoxy-1,4-benzoquinol methylase
MGTSKSFKFTVMQRDYWEKIAPSYNDEIFDVRANDKQGYITAVIKSVASPAGTVLDAGCAIGKWLPVLSPLFKKVIAADISAKNLSIARKKYPEYTNVVYLRTDMSARSTQLQRYDVVVCINAILSSSLKKRTAFFQNLSTSVKKGGRLVLVVPSLESWLLTRIIQQQWKIDKTLFKENLSGIGRYQDIQQGNAEIDNVATKHYLREELQLLLSRERFKPLRCEKIEYEWNTEFLQPPVWLKKPGPWDWLILAEKC